MDVNDDSGKGSEKSEKDYSFHCLREYIYHHEQKAARNMNVPGDSGEMSVRKEEDVIGHRRKAFLVINGRDLGRVGFYCWVEVELVSSELGYLAKEISKQCGRSGLVSL